MQRADLLKRDPALGAAMREGPHTHRGTVFTYSSRFGMPRRSHQRMMLAADAKAVAKLKRYEFGGDYDAADKDNRNQRSYFVPDDTLLLDEAQLIGIQTAADLYGGVVPYPFVATKAITHPLVDQDAERPYGWASAFADRVQEAVFPGYTAFSYRDARIAARRLLRRGPIRLKEAYEAGGRGQTRITTLDGLDAIFERCGEDNISKHGLILEENLQHVTTLSIGHIMVDDVSFTYHGRQRVTTNNKQRLVYGGSDLVCVRGGWDSLDRLALPDAVRASIAKARLYDEAMDAYAGFMASRRNYDVGLGLDVNGQPRCGVFESSWRVGGATGAEIAALTEFMGDSCVQVVEASHVEQFGQPAEPPAGAIMSIQLDDPQEGPMSRFTIVSRIERTKPRG